MIRKQSRREWSDKMSDIQNERLIEFISNSKVAFINGQFQEAFTLAKEAIKLTMEMTISLYSGML